MSGKTLEASSSSAKRKRKMVSFHSFPERTAIRPTDCFEESLKFFLSQYTDSVDECKPFPARRTYLEHDKCESWIPLYYIEEIVEKEDQWCYQCFGWEKYMMDLEKIYHFIVPRKCDWNKQLMTNYDILNENPILHGKFHWNGDGHLLRINGLDRGSTISGRELMDLWDRICKHLNVREVTVIDTSIKRSIDLRLILGIGYRQSWFARWGYSFPQNSYKGIGGITEEHYNRAVEVIWSLPLNDLVRDSRGQHFHDKLKKIIDYYGKRCDIRLTTLERLFNYILLTRNSRIPRATEMIPKQGEGDPVELSRLTVNILKKNQKMTRQEIIDVAPKRSHMSKELAGVDIYSDLITVYKAVRSTYQELHPIRKAMKTISDAQHLSKKYVDSCV